MGNGINQSYKQTNEGGFTIVETIVTLVVVTLFITSFFYSYLLLESQRVVIKRQAIASDIAYSNLGKVVSISRSSVSCKTSDPPNLPDLLDPSTGSGYSATSGLADQLGADSVQHLWVQATGSCTPSGGFADDQPVRLISSVVFTAADRQVEVRHAKLVQ